MQQITVGNYTITALSDGLSRLPPMFFPGLDPATTSLASTLTALSISLPDAFSSAAPAAPSWSMPA